jgi:transketolase
MTALPTPGVTGNLLASDSTDKVPTVEAPFGHALVHAAEHNPKIVGLSADLCKYTDMDVFAHRFPDRFFQIGMAEQNLVGVAAGLARTGFVPFATTYCVFATRRAYDFIAIGIALGNVNVKLIAGLPGLTTGYGGTHQGIEDLALMRSVPNLTVIDPCDATEITQAVAAIADHEGPVYLRLLRGNVPVVLDPETYRFKLGKSQLLRQGSDVAMISTGLMTGRTLEAARELAREGIGAAVLHVSTLKPFDREAVLSLVSRVPQVVTAENHLVTGGLASTVADTVADAGISIRLKRVGIPDCFCESGSIPYLTRRYGLDVASLVAAARTVQERKQLRTGPIA